MLLISLLLSIGSYFYRLPYNIFFYSHRVRVLSESDTIYNLKDKLDVLFPTDLGKTFGQNIPVDGSVQANAVYWAARMIQQ